MNVTTKAGAGRRLAWADLPAKCVLLMLQTAPGTRAVPPAASAAGRKRQIMIDGILMEMDEAFILGQIRAGTFIVVYPGTNIPWDRGNDPHPTYPPDWFPA